MEKRLFEYLRSKTALNVRTGIYFHFLTEITSSFTVKMRKRLIFYGTERYLQISSKEIAFFNV